MHINNITSKFSVMTYNIIGIFPTNENAISAATKLKKSGFVKQFEGFVRNTKFQPESLVEDHFIDDNQIAVYTSNLNRAYKARNILLEFGAEIKDTSTISTEKITQINSKESTSSAANKKRKATATKFRT